MNLLEIGRALDDWVCSGRTAAVATLVSARHSAPLPVGSRLVANDAGELRGSISNGCVEGDLYEHLQAVLAGASPEVVRYGLTDDTGYDIGLTCGGEIDVLVERYDPASPGWLQLLQCVRDELPAVRAVGLSEDIRSANLTVFPGGVAGSLGHAELDALVLRHARPCLETGHTGVANLETRSGAQRVFLEAHLPPPRLAIVGATAIGSALCGFASRLGYRVDVIDPRSALADPAKLPSARRVLHTWPDEGLREIALGPDVAGGVLTHDAKLDVPALATALETGCRYVGLLGGRRTQQLRREALRELGFGEEDLARIRGPVGLDIGSETPEEIALSIAAQLVEAQRTSE